MMGRKEKVKAHSESTLSLTSAFSGFYWKQLFPLPEVDLFQESVMKFSHILQLFFIIKTTGLKHAYRH